MSNNISSVAHRGLVTGFSSCYFFNVSLWFPEFRFFNANNIFVLPISISFNKVVWYVIVDFNIGECHYPLSGSYSGEFLSFLMAFSYSIIAGLMALSGIVISAGYSIYIYIIECVLGCFSKYIYFSWDLNHQEFCSLVPLIILIVRML